MKEETWKRFRSEAFFSAEISPGAAEATRTDINRSVFIYLRGPRVKCSICSIRSG